MTREDIIIRNINNTNLDRPIRAKSMVATIFGDFIDPHGGKIWLGNLISLVKLFDINERLLRTSIFRLAEDGWVKKTKEGRRSFYELTTEGQEQTVLASELIYHFKQKSWNGVWDFVISTSKEIHAAKNNQLRHRLSLMGFGVLSKNIYAHPDVDNELIDKIIKELGLERQVLVMQSQASGPYSESNNQELVKQCCPYDEVEKMYIYFLRTYTPVLKWLKKKSLVKEDVCFMIRVLLVHDYRRLLFKDPQLPAELLPPDWSGDAARVLVKRIYKLTHKQANNYFLMVCEDETIKPRLKKSFFSRFGGLD